jgi:hypothetical protein
MQRRVWIATVFLITWHGTLSAQTSAKLFEEICADEKSVSCRLYLNGFIEGLAVGEVEFTKNSKITMYCSPGRVNLALLASLAKEHFKRRPTDETFGSAPIILDELKHLYPCPR